MLLLLPVTSLKCTLQLVDALATFRSEFSNEVSGNKGTTRDIQCMFAFVLEDSQQHRSHFARGTFWVRFKHNWDILASLDLELLAVMAEQIKPLLSSPNLKILQLKSISGATSTSTSTSVAEKCYYKLMLKLDRR